MRDRLAARTPFVVFAAAAFDHQPHPDTHGMPAGGAQPLEMRPGGRLFVEMKRLRIETRRKRFDRLGGERVAPHATAFANLNILEELHG